MTMRVALATFLMDRRPTGGGLDEAEALLR
jgi:hypothetical protein